MPDGATVPAKRGRGRPYPPTALQSANPQDILNRYLADESTEQIAKSFGVTDKALGYFLRTHAQAQWVDAQIIKAVAVKDRADERLEALQARIDAFKDIECDKAFEREKEACRQQLALARTQANRAEFEVERLLSRLYGQKHELTHQAGSSLLSILASIDAPKIIEGEATEAE